MTFRAVKQNDKKQTKFWASYWILSPFCGTVWSLLIRQGWLWTIRGLLYFGLGKKIPYLREFLVTSTKVWKYQTEVLLIADFYLQALGGATQVMNFVEPYFAYLDENIVERIEDKLADWGIGEKPEYEEDDDEKEKEKETKKKK